MASKILLQTGALTPLHFGNPVAPKDGSALTHDPWVKGVAAYLVQTSAADSSLTLSTGQILATEADSVVIITDSDALGDSALILACGVDALFFNGMTYFGKAGSDIRWTRDLERNSQPYQSSRMSFALVVHTNNLLPYTCQLVNAIPQVTIDLPTSGLRLLQLTKAGQSTLKLADDTVVTLSPSNAAAGGAGAGSDSGGTGQAPWPPK